MTRSEPMPLARQEQLVVQEVADETIIYDEQRDHVHRLNRTAALVWRYCDGSHTVAALAQAVSRELASAPGVSAPVTEDVVWLALDRLDKEKLLQGTLARPEGLTQITRRDVLRRAALIGGLAVLIPVVQSVVAPTPAMAMSIGCAKRGEVFSATRPCCPGLRPGAAGKCTDRAGNV